MGFLSFRLSTEKDLPFYQALLNDPEWINNSGLRTEDFCTEDKILHFITKQAEEDIKGIVVKTTDKEDIGFCHFKYLGSERYDITGGIKTSLLNKGYGLYSFVYCIDYLFRNRPCKELQSIVYELNSRSKKMDLSVGFLESDSLYYDIRKFIVYVLTPDNFYNNPFTQYILKRYL